MSEHVAIGPNGGTLVGFLCGVGALAVLQDACGERSPRMSWRFQEVGWRPVFELDGRSTADELVAMIDDTLGSRSPDPAFDSLDELPTTPDDLRRFVSEAAERSSPSDRRGVDFASAYACEAFRRKNGTVETTQLRAVGTGRQRFMPFARQIAAGTTREHIHAALFDRWKYSDDKLPSLRWDAADDRRYALRADDPSNKVKQSDSTSPILTVPGANRLGLEALPSLPVMPGERRLNTTGFKRVGRSSAFRWALWTPPLSLDVTRSLVANQDVADATSISSKLERLGICALYESRRIRNGDYWNFSPAVAVAALSVA